MLFCPCRYDGEVNTGKLERAGAVHRVGQTLLSLALKHTLAVLAVNQVGDTTGKSSYIW